MTFNVTFLLLLIFFTLSTCCNSITFTVTNNCSGTIWPATLSGSGSSELAPTGFELGTGKSMKLTTSGAKWSGRIWGRTGCKFDGNGEGKCETGDCGGKLECKGSGAKPPASLFEITVGGASDEDFYDVSLVDGYNLPMLVVPSGVYGNSPCNSTGCISNINTGCPKELQVKGGNDGIGSRGVVGCRSACEAFGSDQYCCSGQHGNPSTCSPSRYSTIFKKACPRAYSYAYDDKTSTFTCKAHSYDITFCPYRKTNKRNGKSQGSGSSNALFPYSWPISLCIAALTFWTSVAAWSFT